jgi:trans-4-hydroxy-L-proline dehydratase
MTGAILFNLASVLELALHNGRHPLTGRQVGPATGSLENFRTFDQLFTAFTAQLETLINLAAEGNAQLATAHADLHPTPLLSALIDGTAASGRDVTRGGATYNSSGVAIIGLADVADSLTALKHLVYDQKRLTQREVSNALKSDFVGHERTHVMLRRKAPKYGTDDPRADAMASGLVKQIGEAFARRKAPRGGHYQIGYWSITIHAGFGALTGALPNGRKRATPLSSGATPVAGVATRGPTAAFNSTAKLPARHLANGIANNHKLSRELLGQPGKLELLGKLVEGFFAQGGFQVQFTVQDRETLLAAQQNPEAYRDLLVRVSGYTAYFCDLNRRMQDEIIARTEDRL